MKYKKMGCAQIMHIQILWFFKKISTVVLLFNFSEFSIASTVIVDQIILDSTPITFGSSIKENYYYPLQKSEYLLGFLHAQENHFSSKKIPSFRAGVSGCVNSLKGLWGIEDKKLFLLDLKSCPNDFEVRNFSRKVFASWVSGIFLVEHPIKSAEISCLKKNTYLLRNQKFYYLSIQAGEVMKFEIITEDVIFRDNIFARFSVERYLMDPESKSVVIACN